MDRILGRPLAQYRVGHNSSLIKHLEKTED